MTIIFAMVDKIEFILHRCANCEIRIAVLKLYKYTSRSDVEYTIMPRANTILCKTKKYGARAIYYTCVYVYTYIRR